MSEITQRRVPLIAVPCTITEACDFVALHHRHHKPPLGALWSVAAAVEGSDAVVAVAIVGRPVARMADNGWTAEVVRLASDGTPFACSFLYAACWRAAKALGYQKIITYTLAEEPGTSLRAAGWICVGESKGGTWNRKSRPRVDAHPLQAKLRWVAPGSQEVEK